MRSLAFALLPTLAISGCGGGVESTDPSPEPTVTASADPTRTEPTQEDPPAPPQTTPPAESASPSVQPSDASSVAELLLCDETQPLEAGATDDPPPTSLVTCVIDGINYTIAAYEDGQSVATVIQQIDSLLTTLTFSGVIGSGDNWVVFERNDIVLPTLMQERVRSIGGTITSVGG